MPNYNQELIDSSEIFKALAHPARICIVNRLTNSSLNVSEMQRCLDVSQSSISQHLTILKSKGIIKGERIGSEVIYSLVDKRMYPLVKIFLSEE